MQTIKVQWQAKEGQWQVRLAEGQILSLEQWADNQPDLTSVRMILAAPNYGAHWLSLSGVSQRHLAKVLPFALEELLIEDIGYYHIVPADNTKKRVRAYVVANALIKHLLATCALHHLRVYELIPESWLLGNTAQCVRQDNGWLFVWPHVFEGAVADNMLTPVLDALFSEDLRLEKLHIKAPSMDSIRLLKSVLETSYPEQVATIEAEVVTPESELSVPAKAVNLLSGVFQQRAPKEEKPRAWWRPVLTLAAVWIVLWTVSLYSDVHQLQQQSNTVRDRSIALYKQLFPGERIRMLERQFQEKLTGGSIQNSEGFLSTTLTLAQVYAQQTGSKIELLSLRYNERMKETTIELKAANLNELQALRQALENAGVTAEIASATNDQDGVKGRLRITG